MRENEPIGLFFFIFLISYTFSRILFKIYRYDVSCLIFLNYYLLNGWLPRFVDGHILVRVSEKAFENSFILCNIICLKSTYNRVLPKNYITNVNILFRIAASMIEFVF